MDPPEPRRLFNSPSIRFCRSTDNDVGKPVTVVTVLPPLPAFSRRTSNLLPPPTSDEVSCFGLRRVSLGSFGRFLKHFKSRFSKGLSTKTESVDSMAIRFSFFSLLFKTGPKALEIQANSNEINSRMFPFQAPHPPEKPTPFDSFGSRGNAASVPAIPCHGSPEFHPTYEWL